MTIGIVLALCSAWVWGSGDYCGGRAATRLDPFMVLTLAGVSGIVLLVGIAVARAEPVTLGGSLLWAAGAGLCGSGGIVALYRGLAVSNAATVAPLASVLAAVIPVVVSSMTEGRPANLQLLGFILALLGIWLVTQAAAAGAASSEGIRLGMLAGLGFGGFLVLIAQVPSGAVFIPLAIARAIMLLTGVVAVLARRTPLGPAGATPIALLAGVLDTGGNVLYMLARQYVRLDVAAVLSSLYPVSTVLLSWLISHERVSATQWLGVAVCIGSIVLITA